MSPQPVPAHDHTTPSAHRTTATVLGGSELFRGADPGVPRLLGPGLRLSGAGLERAVRAAALVLADAGADRSTRIGLVASNGPEAAVAFLAAAGRGICVPVNPALIAAEMTAYVDMLDVHLVALAGSVDPAVPELLRGAGHRVVWLPVLDQDGEGDPGEAPDTDGVGGQPRPDDVCLLLATSGTTSRPKAVPLTHRKILHSARSVAEGLRLGPADRALNVMPLFHIHGLVAGLLAPLVTGGSVYCLPTKDPEVIATALGAAEPTWYTAVPTIHQAVAEAAARGALPKRHRLRFVRSCSAPLSKELLSGVERALGVPVIEAYGMTEGSHQIASNPLPPGERVPNSVGRPAGAEVRVTGADGVRKGPGEVGAVEIRGLGVMDSYLDNPLANEAAFTADGWFRTGDEGYLDAAGRLFLSGRTKEIINRGGEKIFPREIDDVLIQHPDIAEALAFAVPHPRLGEDIAAAVVPAHGRPLGEAAVREFASRLLSPFKVPRLVVVLDKLPVGPTGKPQRIGLADRLGIGAGARGAAGNTALADEVESELSRIWRDLLAIDDLTPTEDFLRSGGDSLLAIRLVQTVNQFFGTDIPVSSVFGSGATIRGMAALVRDRERHPAPGAPHAASTSSPAAADGSPTAPPGERPALAPQQMSLWLTQCMNPSSPLLNTALAIDLRGPLDHELLRSALDRVVARHDVLRSSFPSHQGMPYLAVADGSEIPFDIVEAPDLPADPAQTTGPSPFPDEPGSTTEPNNGDDRLHGTLAELLRPLLTTPFDLAHGPLLRAALLRRTPTHHLCVLVLHHIISDAWSRDVLQHDLLSAYEELGGGGPAQLPGPVLPAIGTAHWQRTAAAARHTADVAFWREELRDLPPYRPLFGGSTPAYTARHRVLTVGRETVAGIVRSARSARVGVFELLLSGIAAALCAHTGRAELGVGVPVSLRNHADLTHQLGYHATMVPLRLRGLLDMPLGEQVARCAASYRSALEHATLPLDGIVAAADRRPMAERGPLFDVAVKRDVRAVPPPKLSGLEARQVPVPGSYTQFPLGFDLTDLPAAADGVRPARLILTHDSSVITDDTAAELADAVLSGLVRVSAGAGE